MKKTRGPSLGPLLGKICRAPLRLLGRLHVEWKEAKGVKIFQTGTGPHPIPGVD